MGIIKNNRNPGVITQEEHSDSARVGREVEYGFVIGTNLGSKATGVHDDIFTAAVFIGANRHVLCTNRDVAIQWVTFGAVGVGVATNLIGVPIFPNDQVRLCSGTSEYIRSSDADVHCVEIED